MLNIWPVQATVRLSDIGATGAPYGERWPLLRLHGVGKSYGAIQALTDVDLAIFGGEVVALVGDNGAGKSTLVKVISGVHPADGGSIFFNGEEVRLHSPADATRHGVETVYQDLALCDNLDIVQNMFLGREVTDRLAPPPFRSLSEVQMERLALDTLKDLQVTTIKNVRSRVAALSGGQRQAIAISKAVMWNSKVVLLDEPTAALGVSQTHQVLELIKRLRAQGLGVVIISHNLHEVFEVADRIAVLRLGRLVATFQRQDVTPEEVIAAITGVRQNAA